jgi:hypothetical protein
MEDGRGDIARPRPHQKAARRLKRRDSLHLRKVGGNGGRFNDIKALLIGRRLVN